MPEIQAFRGIRYNLAKVGALSDVIAPPYDVISPELQEALYRRHPNNVIRLILNRIEPGDDETNNRYSRAKRFYRSWLAEGILAPDADPAVYVYQQEFEVEGRRYVRTGFMSRVKLSHFHEGQIFPHEETLRGPKMDQLMLMTVCRANMSQVFGLYPDPESRSQDILTEAVAGRTPLEAVDHLDVVHRLWPIYDVELIARLAELIGPQPVFIADGHHRYETALEYREQIRDMGLLRPDHPAHYVLMHCVAMEDPGLIVLPTHRLLRGLPDWSAEDLAERLSPAFAVENVAQGPEAAADVWRILEATAEKGSLGLFTRKDQTWCVARIRAEGWEMMDQAAADHAPEWRRLDVAILHRLVLQRLLGIQELPEPKYVHLVSEVVAGLQTGEFPLAALVAPATVQDIRDVSMQGERMPAKSTYFYPKLCSGLVINPLE